MPTMPACTTRPVEPATPLLDAGHRRPAHRGRRRLFPEERASRKRVEAVARVAKALGATRDGRDSRSRARPRRGLRHHHDRGRRAASRPPAHAAERFRSGGARPADRRRDGAGARWSTRRRNSAAGIARRCWSCSRSVDVILAPATPCIAPKIGQQTFMLDGVELPVRANIGIYTQPISFIGLPVVAVPVPLEPMPIGVQIIAAPWREDIALRVAHALEQHGRRRRARRREESRDGDRSARRARRGDARSSRATRRRW